MKCTGIIALLLILAIPAWSATRSLTVDQLRLLLTDLQRASKSDDQVATELKSVDLTEELTASTMQTFGNLVPGPLSTEQIYVLQARSAMLPAPAADRPADPAPDPAGPARQSPGLRRQNLLPAPHPHRHPHVRPLSGWR